MGRRELGSRLPCRQRLVIDHVGAERALQLGAPVAALGLAVLSATLFLAAIVDFRRRDVLT
jgi:hypothetical protein